MSGIKKDEDSMQRLIDTSSDLSPDTSSSVTHVNETNSKTTGKSKFTIIKYGSNANYEKETPIVARNKKSKSNESNYDDFSIKSYTDLNNNIFQRNNFEEDDVFNEDEPMKDFREDNYLTIKYRESEGQDTITSLTGNPFKKQLEKIRRKASLKSNISTNSSSFNSLNNNNNSQPAFPFTDEKLSSSSLNNTPLNALKSLFMSQESIYSRNTLKFLENSSRNLKSNNNKSTLDLNMNNSLQTPSNRNTLQTQGSNKGSNKSVNNLNTSKSDEVYEVIKEAMRKEDITDPHFIQNVLAAVNQQQLDQQIKKNKARRVCLMAQLFVFIGIILLGFFFVQTVYRHLLIVQNKNRIIDFIPANTTLSVATSLEYTTLSFKIP